MKFLFKKLYVLVLPKNDIDDAEKITSKPHSPRMLETAPAQQKEKT